MTQDVSDFFQWLTHQPLVHQNVGVKLEQGIFVMASITNGPCLMWHYLRETTHTWSVAHWYKLRVQIFNSITEGIDK